MAVRRSVLSTPGSDPDMMETAAASDADGVVLDLEDAVAPDQKVAARGRIADAIHEFDWGDTLVSVRINDLDHPNAHGDLIELVERAGDRIDTVVVPMVRRPGDVYTVEKLLSGIEAANGIDRAVGIEVLVEDVEALQRIDEIAATGDRIRTLVLGFGDYAASQGLDPDGSDEYPGDVWHFARNRVAIAARANGLDAIDGPYGNLSDTEGFRTEAARSAALGFVGKWAIHPSQVEIANEVYAPTDSEVEHARRVIEAVEAGRAAGEGAVRLDGEMLVEAEVRLARETLERARRIGMIEDD